MCPTCDHALAKAEYAQSQVNALWDAIRKMREDIATLRQPTFVPEHVHGGVERGIHAG